MFAFFFNLMLGLICILFNFFFSSRLVLRQFRFRLLLFKLSSGLLLCFSISLQIIHVSYTCQDTDIYGLVTIFHLGRRGRGGGVGRYEVRGFGGVQINLCDSTERLTLFSFLLTPPSLSVRLF